MPKELPNFQIYYKFKEQQNSSPNSFKNSDFLNIFRNLFGIPQMRAFSFPKWGLFRIKNIFLHGVSCSHTFLDFNSQISKICKYFSALLGTFSLAIPLSLCCLVGKFSCSVPSFMLSLDERVDTRQQHRLLSRQRGALLQLQLRCTVQTASSSMVLASQWCGP